MTTTKAAQIAKDIETARLKGNWKAIPDLARRFKKYNPGGTVIEQTILVEASLAQLRVEHHQDEDRPLLDVAQVQPLRRQLESALHASSTDTDPLYNEFAKIVLARCHFECGEYQQTLSIVEGLAFKREDVSVGVGLVLFLQARTIKAISQEMTGDKESAIKSHLAIVALLLETQDTRDRVLAEWAEEGLYKAIQLVTHESSNLDLADKLNIMRAYHKMTHSMPYDWRTVRRLKTTWSSIRQLSEVYQEGQYLLPVGAPNEADIKTEFTHEIMQLHTAYEQMVGQIVQFPKAGQTNVALLQFIEQLAVDMSLIEPTHSQLRGYIEVLNRATQRAFNSPCITRHLFLALHALGDYDEAKHALSTYLYLVGLSSQAWENAAQDGEALVVESLTRRRVPIPRVSEIERLVNESAPGAEGDAKSIASQRSTENESVDNIVTVLMTAVTMYAESLQDGVKAVEAAELARCKLSHLPPAMQAAEGLNIRVLRHAGAAYNVLASQTHDIALRSSYHDKALEYLKTAYALDENDWQTLYQLSLQYAETRDIQHAIPVIAKALQANPKHIPSWHLLTLLCSCPGQNDLGRALRTCELGLREAQDISQQDTTEQHVLLKITQSLLLDASQGPEAALASHQALFALFGNLATPEGSSSASSLEHDPRRNQMIVSGSLGNLSEYQADSRRGRGSSIGNGSVPHLNESHILASRSHDDVRNKSRSGTLTNRTRSVSSFNKRPPPVSNSMLSVPDQRAPDTLSVKELSTHSGKHHHHHHHGLHLFSSRSTSRRSRRDESQEWSEKNSPSKSSLSPDAMSMQTSASSMHSISRSSTRTLLEPTTISTRPTARARMRQRKEAHLLSDLWLLSASTFLKINKLEEARKAIEEAENADWTNNSGVWCTLGRLRMLENNQTDAVKAFHKGLVVDANDISCRIWMAKAYLQQGETELAEGLLESVTKQNGWDSSEAWFYLGEMYKASGRTSRSKECLLYALELENTRPVQPFSILPRFA